MLECERYNGKKWFKKGVKTYRKMTLELKV